jgi:Predicted metal-dependent phosphoesterases (PHP family)
MKKHEGLDDLIDLHMHSSFSDGELKPNELIKLAVEKGIGTIAITDHDTLLGNQNINCDETKFLDIISGIELSAKAEKGRMHILGYGIDIRNKELNEKMKELKNNSIYSVLSLIHQIKKDYGIILNSEDILGVLNSEHNIGRPDLAKLLVSYGLAPDFQTAFDKYLIDSYNKVRSTGKGIEYDECIDLILKAGGIPILAHPKTLELNQKDFLILLKQMISVGLRGIEVYHSSFSFEESENYMQIAERLGLLYSGGSDFHGPVATPNIEIGTGKNNNLKIKKLSILDHIKR